MLCHYASTKSQQQQTKTTLKAFIDLNEQTVILTNENKKIYSLRAGLRSLQDLRLPPLLGLFSVNFSKSSDRFAHRL